MKHLLLAFLFLSLSSSLRGQGFGSFSHDPTTLVGGAPQVVIPPDENLTNILTQYTNMYRWWVSEDLAIGTVAAPWVDRIAGDVLAQGDGTKRPSNTADGVYFDGSDNFLTNAPLNVGGPIANALFMFIIKMNNPPSGSGIWRVSSGSSTGFRLLSGIMRYKDATDGIYLGGADFPENVFTDFMMHELDFYTNGVLYNDNLGNNLVNGAALDELGKDYEGTHPGDYTVKEIIIWTNTGFARPLPTQVRSNLHYYATERGVTP